MTIAANSKKTKGRKKAEPTKALDPMEELRSIIQSEMARREARPAAKIAAPAPFAVQPQSTAPTTSQVQTSAPTVKVPVPMTNPPPPRTISEPDFSALSGQLMQIAGRSQKMLNAYLARNKTLSEKLPSRDPANLCQAFSEFTNRLISKPEVFVEINLAFWQDYVRLLQNTMARAGGQPVEPVIQTDPADKRFKDVSWQENWVFDFIKQSYLLAVRWAQAMVQNVDGLDPKIAHKIEFYTRQMVDALSPSNFWITNPEVLRTTMETRGENLIKGLENLLDDIERGQGQLLINMSDHSAFRLGENIATTPGKVVFQNELIQLIQYAPLTEKAHKTPMLIVPPWINKFYILDLKPENSFIRYLVEQGHTVFCISWVNPDSQHANINFDDYMMLGPVAAATEIARITGENRLNCTGYCIGGTLLASTLAWLEGAGEKKPKDMPEIASATYLVTMIDFAEPGDLGVFVDEEQISAFESLMENQGYLAGTVMSTTFSLLRANDLIWSFVVNNYLLGKEPFPFDLLTWNSDSTNLPQAMQSFYLRNMYLSNNLIKPNGIAMKGVPIDLRKIKVPSFCLSTHDDHITPWRSTYVSTQTYSAPVTFCLSGSGHIAGVVNPPAKEKYGYWTNNNTPTNPDDWMKSAQKHKGSWWPEWIKWLDQHAGEMVDARDPAQNDNVIEDAPGSYVKVRVV